MKRLALLVLLGVVAVVAFAAIGDLGGPTKPAAAAGTTPAEGVSQFLFPGADFVNVVSQECLPGNSVRINVTWNPYNLGPQWIDLSLQNNGWIFGTFIGLGALPGTQANFTWDGLLPGLTHYLRINTLTAFGWFPSSTIAFVTRGDCFFDIDSDGDGVPNSQDSCPFIPGPAINFGCPLGGAVLCDPVTGWCPGQLPPASRCPTQIVIQIFPPPPVGCVWPTKGEGASYFNGEPIRVCYWVNQPMNVFIQTLRPDGTLVTNAGPGFDDGRGNCVDGLVGVPPAGQRTIRLFTGAQFNQLLDTAVWTGQ